ncbi:Fe-S-containing protein [Fonticella tunisiensis]|uniref:FTR1 family protein n=1 Tax=Fonticella tunisiensis TaxID=1096341 RepID=A0A4R7KL29_9CLOT|nr:Fe-S-containing protein [Fonticella tunisiensis]TDT57261.1 FTR1 family protein [Fonticella tunisiensis]
MIEALVVTLREGIEAALVVGIIVAYLNKTEKFELKKHAYFGLALAVVASILGAVIFNLIGFDPENEVLEGIMFFTAAVFVGSMVIWMQKTSKNIKNEMEEKLHNIVNQSSDKDLKKQGIGILAFTFFMVFREGIETVLFMTALTTESNAFLSFLGGLVGIALSVLFAVFFIRGSLKINLSRFFKVTSWILMILVVRLFAGGLHEFGEVGIIPLGQLAMKIIGLIVRDNSTVIISMMLLTLPIVMVLLDSKNTNIEIEGVKEETGAEKRKRLAEIQRDRMWKKAVIVSALAINLILGFNLYSQATRPVFDPNPQMISAVNGEIKIPLESLKENIMSKYAYEVDGVNVRFILVKRPGNAVSSGLDACDICGAIGYFQEQGNIDNIICKNCNAPIPMTTIGYPGGCNPIPIKTEVVNNNIVVKVGDLAASKNVFAGGVVK